MSGIHDRANPAPSFREHQAIAVAEAVAGLFCPLLPSDAAPGAVTVPDTSALLGVLRTVAAAGDTRLSAVARRALDAWNRKAAADKARAFLEGDGFAFGAVDATREQAAWRDRRDGLGNVVPLHTHSPAARRWHPLDSDQGLATAKPSAKPGDPS